MVIPLLANQDLTPMLVKASRLGVMTVPMEPLSPRGPERAPQTIPSDRFLVLFGMTIKMEPHAY